jgi:uncharacterized OB-fold protein
MIDYEDFYDKMRGWFNMPPGVESIILEYLRPKMEWKPQFSKEYGYVIYHCSNCGNDELVKTPFCPQCGAMETKEEDLE